MLFATASREWPWPWPWPLAPDACSLNAVRAAFMSSKAITFVRMCLLQAGTKKRKTKVPKQNLVTALLAVVLATAATPPSKQCSQENPTRIASAWMIVRMAFVPASAPALSLAASSITSSKKTINPAKIDRTSARSTRPMIEGIKKIGYLTQIQRVLKRVHHANSIAKPEVEISPILCNTLPSRAASPSSSASWPKFSATAMAITVQIAPTV
mmetsp:Transcript_21844/g.38648  ORF Transcript_21844/g.38648 Transcript_21844/m.38648 type:complete len:212 (-) Transcript_21844:768-1403(-)